MDFRKLAIAKACVPLNQTQKLFMETEDPIKDPKLLLENKCLESCRELVQKLSECEKRVNSRQGFTSETCVQELFDLTPCLDNCVLLSEQTFLGCKEVVQGLEMMLHIHCELVAFNKFS